jgi:hypothetical protein
MKNGCQADSKAKNFTIAERMSVDDRMVDEFLD